MKNLRENGYIHMDADGYITLTEKGPDDRRNDLRASYADFQLAGHTGRGKKTAIEDACRIEHVISIESFEGN